MVAYDALKEAVALFAASASLRDIGHALHRIAERFGLSITLIVGADDQCAATMIEEFADAKWVVDGLYPPWPSHPLLCYARASMRPFLLSQLGGALAAQLQPWQMQGHANSEVIVAPVHHDGRLAWCAVFTGHPCNGSPAVESVLGAVVYAAFERSRELPRAGGRRVVLTARESICLQLVAAGKTDSEISHVLGISARTVRFHVDNAKMKLGVATRIQAVAKRALLDLGREVAGPRA